MHTSTAEFTNTVTASKGGHPARLKRTLAKPRPPPFVVSSVSTKRYAPAVKTPVRKVRKMSPTPPPILTKERLPIIREAPAKLRPSLARPTSMPASNVKASAQALPSGLSARGTFPRKQYLPQPPRFQAKLEHDGSDELQDGYRRSVTHKPAQATTMHELPPRPSCVPQARIYRPSASISEAHIGTHGVRVKITATGPPNPGVPRKKPAVTVSTAKVIGHTRASNATVKKPVTVCECRPETPTRNRVVTQVRPIVRPFAFKPVSQESSPSASPNLSSCPSQGWTIVVDVDIKGGSNPITACDDETLSADVVQESVFAETYNEPASSPTASSSPTIIQTPGSPEDPTFGSDSKHNSPMAEPSAEVSHMTGAATIISPTSKGSSSSVANLARVLQKNPVPSPPRPSQAGNGARTTVQGAFNFARTVLSPLQLASQIAAEAVSRTTTGTNVTRIRNLFVPPLDKDTKASKDPATQMEIEMLRAQRKVANGGVVDPRLNRLGSLAAMAIAAKRLSASTSDSASQA